MNQEFLISLASRKCRAAIIEDGALAELQVERQDRPPLVGNIYKAKVSRVLPGLQAAFLDIGLERAGFLHRRDLDGARDTDIAARLAEGQALAVQILCDASDDKGPRLSTRLRLPSRHLVACPGANGVTVSRRIADPQERERLRHLAKDCLASPPPCGLIVRTAAAGADGQCLRREIGSLLRLQGEIAERGRQNPAPALLHRELPLPLRMLRDRAGPQLTKVRIDSEDTCREATSFAKDFLPMRQNYSIEHYRGPPPLFGLYSIEDELQQAFLREVPLECGGNLRIDQAEAMTVIDVNTGSFVSGRNRRDTVYRANLEAARAVARQLRLRNLGGIVIVDFIDMPGAEDRARLLSALERHLEQDPARVRIGKPTAPGVVQLTRQRTRDSLDRMFCRPCPLCQGRGRIKKLETICDEIAQRLLHEAHKDNSRRQTVIAAPAIIQALDSGWDGGDGGIEEHIRCPVILQTEPNYGPEQYDIASL